MGKEKKEKPQFLNSSEEMMQPITVTKQALVTSKHAQDPNTLRKGEGKRPDIGVDADVANQLESADPNSNPHGCEERINLHTHIHVHMRSMKTQKSNKK